MIKRITGVKKAGLSRYQISYTGTDGRYHRHLIWAKNKSGAEEELARREGLIDSSITWGEGARIFTNAKFGLDATERYLENVDRTIQRLPFKDWLITKTTNEELANHLQQRARDTSAQTSNKERAQILSVLNYLYKVGRISDNPFKFIESIKANPTTRQPLMPNDLYPYLDSLDPYTKPIVAILAYTGIRASEACMIKETDITDSSITVHCKGGKIRTLSTEGIEQIIEEAKSLKKTKRIRSQFLFVNSRGNKWTAKSLWVKTKNCWQHLDNRITLHSLRHGFASALVTECNCTLEQVASALGHSISSKAMTAGYIHTNDNSATLEVQGKISSLLQQSRVEAARQRFGIIN